MEKALRHAAKVQLVQAMLQGHSWRKAMHVAGIQVSRATAYRFRQAVLAQGEEALCEKRAGHPSKVRGAVRAWLEDYYQQHPRALGKAVQALLEDHCGVRISVTHLNRVRAALTGATRRGEKSARSVAGWGRQSPPVGCSSGIAPASNTGGGAPHPGGCISASPAGASHRQNATAIPADAALSRGVLAT